MDYSLGVDLGTTCVAAAVARAGRVDMVPLGDRSVVIPSTVYVRDDGWLVTGDAAARRAVSNPDRVASEIKRRLGDPTPLMLGGSAYPVTDLLGVLLRDVLAKVDAEHGGPPGAVVLTHPATWGPYRRELFEEVPRSAGVEHWRMVSEPEAAAAHYAATREMAVGEVIAVYDFGGGTFDATVVGRTEAGIEVLGTPEGIERLGGADLDEAILTFVNHAAGGALAELDLGDARTVVALARLRQDCVLAKEALSLDTETVIPVFIPGRHQDVALTRDQFEAMIRAQVESTIGTLNRALRSADIPPSRLSAVLLVGGSAQIPVVARMVGEQLGCPTIVDAHPKHPVALGAATVGATPGSLPGPVGAAIPAPARGARPEPAAGETAPVADRRVAGAALPTPRSSVGGDAPGDRHAAPEADRAPAGNGRPGMLREAAGLAAGAATVAGASTGQAPPAPEVAGAVGTPAAGGAGAAPPVAPGAPPGDRPAGGDGPAGRPPGSPGAGPPPGGLPPGDGGPGGPPLPPEPPDTTLGTGRPPPGAGPDRGPAWWAGRRRALVAVLGAVVVVALVVLLAVVLTRPDGAADEGTDPSASTSAPSDAGTAAPPPPPSAAPAVPIPSLGTPVPAGPTPNFVAVAPNGDQLYVANGAAGTITVVDTAVDTVTATIDVPAGPPQYLAFSPDGRRIYVSVWNDERTIAALVVVDATRNAVIETIPMASRPFVPAVTPDGHRVYVPNHDTGNIAVIDPHGDAELYYITVPPNPHWVSFSGDGTRAYVANHESNLVSVVDVASNEVVATVPVETSPHSLAVHPTRPLVGNVNYDAASVTFVDTTTNTLVATVPVGQNPQYFTWSADGRFAYTVNNSENTVSVIDAETFTVTATVPTGASPTSMAVLPDGTTAYVSDEDAGTLTVLNVGS
ncbi:Hsp70 family protein [Geodermatophilus sp. SYSU D00708]